jgi:TetR/AcrR family tetracycline transcriptional repressor
MNCTAYNLTGRRTVCPVTATRRPGQRAGLDRTAVLAAARALLESDGGGALSLRAVARELGVAPNALYSHLDGHTDLVDGVLDDLLGDVPTPPPGRPAAATLTDVLVACYDLLARHPQLVPVYLSRQGARGPNAVRLGAVMDDLLTAAGVDPEAAGDARRALLVHLLGSAAYTAASTAPGTSEDPAHLRTLYLSSLQWMLAGLATTAGPEP